MPTRVLDKPPILKNERPTIALLAGAMSSSYQELIMRGVAHVVAEKNYNLVVFWGGAVHSKDLMSFSREEVFDLVDMDLIDGVISPFSSHTRFLDKKESTAFINQFASVPIVNIGSHLSGHTNILPDFETGFAQLFNHLYHSHGYRRILFMRGPKNHASSELREEVYRNLLQEYGLPFEQNMLIYSNLNKPSAKQNMMDYLDQPHSSFDAIISMNDNQAIGILEACQELDIKIPEAFAVVGSMNTIEGAFASSPLTSIKEPLFELGQAAALELIRQMEGKPPVSEIYIPSSLVIRQSCGCQSTSAFHNFRPLNEDCHHLSKKQCQQSIFHTMSLNVKQIIADYQGGIIADEALSLLASYEDSIKTRSADVFLTTLKHKLDSLIKQEQVMVWLLLAAELQLSTLRFLALNRDDDFMMTLLAKLMILKSETEHLTTEFQRFKKHNYLNSLRIILTTINSSFDFSMIKEGTVDVLKLSELYISTFHDVKSSEATAMNILAIRNHQSIHVPSYEKRFFAKKLLPDGIEHYQDRYTLMVFPLSFSKKPIGFMVLNLSDRSGYAFENLRAIISSALKNELVIQELQKAEKRFSDIAHSTSNWLWETDVEHHFTYCSDSSNDIIGYLPDTLIGQKIDQLCIRDGQDAFIKKMNEYENLSELEYWYQHQNGQAICLSISAKAIFNDNIFCGYRGVFEDITEAKLHEDKIKSLAYSDILTGLPNRTLFQEKLAETISFSAINKQQFALMFFDLDYFKEINDSMGHAAGDLLLIKLAKRLSKLIRSQDLLARIGGDEFIIILPDISVKSEITDIVKRIFNDLEEPFLIHHKAVKITLSLGISLYPTDGISPDSLLQKGDNAMYKAKSQGRNRYVFYEQTKR